MSESAPATPRRAPIRERDTALTRIEAAAARAGAGEPCLLVVEGAAGIGKTALLTEARRRLNDGPGRVLLARPGPDDAASAYGVVRQLLGSVLGRDGTDAHDTQASLVIAALGEQDAPVPTDKSFGVIDALYWFVADLSVTRSIVMLIDDLHWADAPSLRFLAHLVRRCQGLRLAVVVALRPNEPGSPHDLIDPICLDPLAEPIRLAALSVAAVHAIVEDHFGRSTNPAFLEACHRSSAGNPLYLRELIRAVDQDDGPPTDDAVQLVAAVSPASIARHVLRRVRGPRSRGDRAGQGDGHPR